MSEAQTHKLDRIKNESRLKALLLKEGTSSDPELVARRRDELEALTLWGLATAKGGAARVLHARLKENPRSVEVSSRGNGSDSWQITLPLFGKRGTSITLQAKDTIHTFNMLPPLIRIYEGEASAALEANPGIGLEDSLDPAAVISSFPGISTSSRGAFGMDVAELSTRRILNELEDTLLLGILANQVTYSDVPNVAFRAGTLAIRAEETQ